jgi:hypothetical protein
MRTIESAKNAVYADSANKAINMTVKFAEFDFELPILASATDATTWGKQLYADALAGKYGEVAPYPYAPAAIAPEVLEAAATKQALKESAIAKLVALGLTEDEALSLI